MNTISQKNRWRSPYLKAMLGAGFLLLVGGVAYRTRISRPIQQSIAVAATPTVETVSALGRLEPEGEVIQVFAPTSLSKDCVLITGGGSGIRVWLNSAEQSPTPLVYRTVLEACHLTRLLNNWVLVMHT
jgi:hypothetical protein